MLEKYELWCRVEYEGDRGREECLKTSYKTEKSHEHSDLR